MNLIKTVFVGLAVSVLITLWQPVDQKAQAQESGSPYPVTLYLFWGNGCPHCAAEEDFLKSIENNYPTLTIKRFEVWGSAKNREIFKDVAQKLKVNVSGVPFTVIGSNHIQGYNDDETTGAQIRTYIESCVQNSCPDVVSEFSPAPKPKTDIWKDAPISISRNINVPVIGNIDLTTLSLPVIAAVIGTLDGFNPCAMWTLLFLISLLVNLKDRKRMWLLGISFLVVSGLVYFLFMAAWLNILLFLGFIIWVRLAVALFAIIAGSFSLNKYYQHKMGCIVENDGKRKKTFEKLKKITYDKNLWMALGGISALAFAVNLIELLCSAGFPAIFTQILALNNLPGYQYYLYIALYIFFFMLDDLIIFFIAMRTLEVTGISTKYAKYSNLIGGILMIAIGLLMVFKPQYLMFNFR